MNSSHRNNWVGFLLNRPIGVFTLLISIIVLGLIAYKRLPIQMLPDGWAGQWMGVYIPVPEANPYETLEKITRKVEEEFATIEGIKEMRSFSDSDSLWVSMEFSGDTNMDLAYGELRDRMERIRPRLPDGVDRYWMMRDSFDDSQPIMWAGLIFNLDAADDRANHLAENVIKPKLESIPGVAKVDLHGLLSKSIRILLNEDKVRSARLNLYDLVTRLRQDNVIVSAGKIEDAGAEYLLRVNSQFESLEAIANYPVNDKLKLKDVADVREVQSVREWLNRINGKFALGCGIYRVPGENIVETCDRIDKTIKELEARSDLAGFTFFKYFDQGKFINSSFDQLEGSASIGGLLAIAVLFLFLRRVRFTFLITLAIPLSMLITLIYLFFTNGSLNMLSMMGLTIGIGMVIDNAIVILENITHFKNQNINTREATIRGVREVALAITLSTLTSIVIFIPLMFLSDEPQMKVAMMSIGLALSVSLLASLLIALIFIPSVYFRIARHVNLEKTSFVDRVPSLIPWLQRKIQVLLKVTLRFRLAAILILLVFIALTVMVPMQHVQKSMGGGHGDHFHVMVDLPSNLSLDEASDEMGIYENAVLSAENKQKIGYKNVRTQFGRNWGELEVWFDPPLQQEEFKKAVETAQEIVPKRAGTILRYRTHIAGEAGEGENSGLTLAITGRDPDVLAELGREIVTRLEVLPEVVSATTSLERGNDEVRVMLDREKTSSFGLSSEIVNANVEWGLRGAALSRYMEGDRELPFIIQYEHGADESLNQLRDLRIWTPENREVALASLASFSFEKGYGSIRRTNRNTVLQVQIDSHEKDIGYLSSRVNAALAGMNFPSGYGTNTEGGLQQWENSATQMLMVGLLAIVLVFLLMGILFESSMLPISVLGTILFAILGSFWMLYITGTGMDIMAMIGFVILVGVVVNNGILLVDHINRLRVDHGLERTQAILQASQDRLRPILMTALTTIVGLLPMALTKVSPQEGISYNTMSITVMGGLGVATFFTLLVVPLFYTLVEDVRYNFAATMYRFVVKLKR